MISLIDQSNEYLKDTSKKVGKQLKRLYKKIRKAGSQASLEDLAYTVSIGNIDGSLCNNTGSISRLKKRINRGQYKIVDFDIESEEE